MAKHNWKLVTFTDKRTSCDNVYPGTSDKTSTKTIIKRLHLAIVRTKNQRKSISRKHTD